MTAPMAMAMISINLWSLVRSTRGSREVAEMGEKLVADLLELGGDD